LKQVGLLATGDEIIQGDILNTNSQQIALRLTNQNIRVGAHLVSGDDIAAIEQAMKFLLQTHKGLIITGGLGPTSDDLTRYALSKLVEQPLIFDEQTWEYICERLKRFGYHTPPQSNRQQALFPEGATIIPNPNGTAAGCWIVYHDQPIFMLPGPPNECLPMIENIVSPILLQLQFQQPLYRKKWLLLGASEGKIAEELDEIAKPYHCVTGYRLCYPYLECKLISDNQQSINELTPLIEQAIQPYLVGDGNQAASEQIKLLLEKSVDTLGICDLATGGLLENTLKTPSTYTRLYFSENLADFQNHESYIVISGLDEFWRGEQEGLRTQLKIEFHHHGNIRTNHITLIIRGNQVKFYAVEWISHQIIKWLTHA
jgi:nicotinamide-nucleotide amidase